MPSGYAMLVAPTANIDLGIASAHPVKASIWDDFSETHLSMGFFFLNKKSTSFATGGHYIFYKTTFYKKSN